ncbi:MAG: hypothetical protein WD065_04220 [Planctomycetaceae bacterium]
MWASLNQYLLLLVITSPLVGILAIAVISRGGPKAAAEREAVVLHALLTLGLAGLLVIQYRAPAAVPQTNAAARDIPTVQMQGGFRWIGDSVRLEERRAAKQTSEEDRLFHLPLLPIVRMAWGIDGVSLCFIVMTSLVMIPALLSPAHRRGGGANAPAAFPTHHKDDTVTAICLLGCSFGLLGLLAAQDVVWLMACAGMLIGFSAFLLGTCGGVDRREAITRSVARLGMGTLAIGLALIGFVYAFSWMQVWGGETEFLPQFLWQRVQHDLVVLREIDPVADQVWRQTAPAIGLMCLAGAWAWLPMFPLHRRWIPLWRQSPPGLRFVWLCVGSQLGLFGLVQFALPVFGPLEDATIWWSGLLGLSGFLYAQGVMAKQRTFLSAVSYGVVAQQGLCFAALTCGERAAFWGGLLQVVNVGLSVSLLVWQCMQGERTNEAPSWCHRAAIGSMSGIPGTLGFIGQLLMLWGLFRSPIAGEMVLLTVPAIVFGGRLWQWAVQLPFDVELGESPQISNGEIPTPSISTWTARGYAVVVAGVLMICGVHPGLMLNRLRPSTEHLALAGKPVAEKEVVKVAAPRVRDGGPMTEPAGRDREP